MIKITFLQFLVFIFLMVLLFKKDLVKLVLFLKEKIKSNN
jgi:hypothetical protein